MPCYFWHGDFFSEEVIIERFEEMARIFKKGLTYYRRGLAKVDDSIREPALCTAGIIPLVFASVANIYRIHALKNKWTKLEI